MCTIEDKLNIDGGKYILAIVFKIGIILNG